MKENTDLFSIAVGLCASIMKGIKKKLKSRPLIIAGISGAIMAYGTLGALEYFIDGLTMRTAVLISFVVGWVASELTELLDDIVKDCYDIFLAWMKSRFNSKNNDE